MNQKAFAIFVGAIMVFSAFAGMVMLGGDQSQRPIPVGSDSLDTFGVQGRLVEWNFDGLEDTLEMAPESTVAAYWMNMSASQNLTDAARASLPPSLGLSYGDNLYQAKIEKHAAAYFNDTWTEFHWVRPFRVAYEGLVIPYEGFMMIPSSTEYSAVMGKPILFGPQKGLEDVLDVIAGGLPTDKFTLPMGETADLQLATLGKGAAGAGAAVDAAGGYQEFYLGVSNAGDGYSLVARYLQPDASTQEKAKEIADQYGLSVSTQGTLTEVLGTVTADKLQGVLTAFLQP
ncbi:MAG TPA: hypothetical protein VLB04_00905 [Methanotrichaceae archaeon]|nr:hypothetical protein [Methanotrichaceae archaeon]